MRRQSELHGRRAGHELARGTVAGAGDQIANNLSPEGDSGNDRGYGQGRDSGYQSGDSDSSGHSGGWDNADSGSDSDGGWDSGDSSDSSGGFSSDDY